MLALFNADVVVLAEDVFEITNRLIDGTEGVLKAAVVVGGIALVLITYMKTRAWAPTLGMMLLAAIVIWGVNNTTTLEDTADATIEGSMLLEPVPTPPQLVA